VVYSGSLTQSICYQQQLCRHVPKRNLK